MNLCIDGKENYETDELSIARLEELKLRLEQEADGIFYQLGEHRIPNFDNGEIGSARWRLDAELALRMKHRQIHGLAHEIASRKKEERRERAYREPPTSYYFLQICRESLDATLFERYWQRAIERKEQERAVREDEEYR